MSYFDDFDHDNRSRKGNRFLQGFIGAVIGALLTLMLLPLLNLWKEDQQDSLLNENEERAGNIVPQGYQTVKVNVESGIEDAVDKVTNSVVGVVNLQRSTDFWTRRNDVIPAGTGSGVVFDRNGETVFIVTNYHVVEGATEVDVVLADGERIPAEVKGTDPITDLAVIAIESPKMNIEPVQFGDSNQLRVGEPAIAIGNPLGLDFSRSVTSGIISATERSIPQDLNNDGVTDWEMDVLQTDAAINPGNSGGALINIAGQLVGINSAKISKVGVEGMGFAIPINEAVPIINDLLQYGHVRRPVLGITPKDLQEVDSRYWSNTLKLPDDVERGVVVLEADDPASGKLKELDVIVQLDDVDINSSAGLRKYLYSNKKAGESITVTYYRDGKVSSVTYELGEQRSMK